MRRNPIINAPGRTSYYTNSGVPYSTIDAPSDLSTMDQAAQPRETVFINKDNSGARVSGSMVGSGDGAGKNGMNLMWDNERGAPHGNTGQDIGLVKVSAQAKRHQSRSPAIQDQPFLQYGVGTQMVNGRRLTGTSHPSTRMRQLHMRETVQEVREFELVDPRNPYLVRVSGKKNVATYFPLEITDVMVVQGQNNRRHQAIPMDRGYAAPALPINTNMNKLPYLPDETRANMSNLQPFIRNVEFREDNLLLSIMPALQGAGTMTIDWGDGNTNSGVASGDTINNTYAATGVYTVTITNDGDASDAHSYKMFMRADGWVPLALSWETQWYQRLPDGSENPAYNANHNPWSVSGRNVSLSLPVKGSPFIKLFVDWGDGTGSLQNFDRVFPTTETDEITTFDIRHAYKMPGSYQVKIYAEHLVDGALTDVPSGAAPSMQNNENYQGRQQISILRPVRVT